MPRQDKVQVEKEGTTTTAFLHLYTQTPNSIRIKT